MTPAQNIRSYPTELSDATSAVNKTVANEADHESPKNQLEHVIWNGVCVIMNETDNNGGAFGCNVFDGCLVSDGALHLRCIDI